MIILRVALKLCSPRLILSDWTISLSSSVREMPVIVSLYFLLSILELYRGYIKLSSTNSGYHLAEVSGNRINNTQLRIDYQPEIWIMLCEMGG